MIEMAQVLAEGLPASAVVSLDLSCNAIGDEGIEVRQILSMQ